MKPALQKLKRLLLSPFVWLAAAVFLIEEAIWDWAAAAMARLGAVRAVHAIEQRIAALRPHWAFLAFILPSAIFIPAKLLGVHAIAAGHWLVGGAIFLIAKIAGLALFSRIFNLTRPALMRLPWFAHFYAWVMYYRNRIHSFLDNWQAYQHIKQRIRAIIADLKSGLQKLISRVGE